MEQYMKANLKMVEDHLKLHHYNLALI